MILKSGVSESEEMEEKEASLEDSESVSSELLWRWVQLFLPTASEGGYNERSTVVERRWWEEETKK